MSAFNYESLKRHVGHKIACVSYGNGANVAVECEDCHEVLLDYDEHEEVDEVDLGYYGSMFQKWAKKGDYDNHFFLPIFTNTPPHEFLIATNEERDTLVDIFKELSSVKDAAIITIPEYLDLLEEKGIDFTIVRHNVLEFFGKYESSNSNPDSNLHP